MTCQLIYTLNALTLLRAWDDPAFAECLSRADQVVADGVGCVWAVRYLTGKKAERVCGIDLVEELCRVCARDGQSVYLLGGRPGVAERAAQKLQERCAGLTIAGAQSGFWDPGQEAAVVERIQQSGAGLLVVALGQPHQELFLDHYRNTLNVRVGLGVGGTLDVIAGDLKRAPRWLRHLGLEWFYRLLQEPWRLGRVLQLPRFIWVILKTRQGGKKS